MEQLNPNEVYAESNIEQSTTNPVTQPDDLLGIRQSIYNELGVPDLQTNYNNLYKSYLDTEASRDTALNDLENKTLGMNVIRGAQSEANRQFSLQLGEQARGLDVAQRGLQSALTEAQAQYGIRAQEYTDRQNLIINNAGAGITFNDDINTVQEKLSSYQQKQKNEEIMLQYPGAGIKPGDSLEKVMNRLNDYTEEQKKDAEKDAYKEALRALGKSTKGSRRELERRLMEANSWQYEQAKRQTELQTQQLELQIQKARESLNDNQNDPAILYRENTVMGQNGPMSSNQPFQSQVQFGF